jgi:tRNA-dependent cyclodipeptide synthase
LDGAFLGISVGSPYYSRQRIDHYLAWAALKYGAFAFLVGDGIAKYTIAATKHLPLVAAAARAAEIGDNLCSMLEDACRKCGKAVDIFRWKRVEQIPEYSGLVRAVSAEYSTSAAFKTEVRRQVWRNLGSRIAVLGIAEHESDNSLAAQLCDRYILEEIAGLIAMGEFTGYHLELYPGDDLEILERIYRDEFPAISRALPARRMRRFERLQINTDG